MSRRWIGIAALLALGTATCGPRTVLTREGDERFRHIVVDPAGPADPWAKSVGDINGDGLPDLIVGGHRPRPLPFFERVLRKLRIRRIEWPTTSELVWYASPTWDKHVIANTDGFRTDLEVGDIDGDGRNDLVILTDGGLAWLRNPDWSSTTIDTRVLHDVELADFDGDGDLDIVARNQSGWGYDDGNQLHFYRQDSPSLWRHFSISVPHGEGLRVADMDGDTKPDAIVNEYWYRNPGTLSEADLWSARSYSPTWDWPDVFIDVADINGDGNPDVVLAPAEPQGKRYRISWFEAPPANSSPWQEHVVAPDIETVHHFIAAQDLDNDGDVDIVTAQMNQGDDPDEVAVYWNTGTGQSWDKQVIATTGSHSMRVVDIDKDGDMDLFGANWSGRHQAVELWENQTCPTTLNRWRRHVIDARRPWRSIFIMPADLDQDGYEDIVTGAWWYRNPGRPADKWRRHLIGDPAHNVATIWDFDADGDLDILASNWNDPRPLTIYERILRKLRIRRFDFSPLDGGLVWGRNDGSGHFEILRNVSPGEGDFLQGVVAASFDGVVEVALSWHEPGRGVQMLRVPDDPVQSLWTWRRLSSLSQDEDLNAGDIDGDGDVDLLLGTQWLRNEGSDEWTPFVLHPTDNPDRSRLVDLNGDGRLDVVVAFEAISVPGKVVWYEQGRDPTKPWTEHLIATVTGPMSLDVADIEKDGDLDIIVGEHNLAEPETARLLVFENVHGTAHDWRQHVIYTGDEHHDGAQVVDIDNDGDEDIISIGWGHRRVLLYENQNLPGRCPSINQ